MALMRFVLLECAQPCGNLDATLVRYAKAVKWDLQRAADKLESGFPPANSPNDCRIDPALMTL